MFKVHPLLREDGSLHFVGNIEGNTALSGCCDVLVCDGFAGNQILKVTEGTARRLIKGVAAFAKETGSEDVKALCRRLLSAYDISSLGGAIILGSRKPIIKAHGNATQKTIVSVCEMLLKMAEHKAIFDVRRKNQEESAGTSCCPTQSNKGGSPC